MQVPSFGKNNIDLKTGKSGKTTSTCCKAWSSCLWTSNAAEQLSCMIQTYVRILFNKKNIEKKHTKTIDCQKTLLNWRNSPTSEFISKDIVAEPVLWGIAPLYDFFGVMDCHGFESMGISWCIGRWVMKHPQLQMLQGDKEMLVGVCSTCFIGGD